MYVAVRSCVISLFDKAACDIYDEYCSYFIHRKNIKFFFMFLRWIKYEQYSESFFHYHRIVSRRFGLNIP